MLDDSLKTHDSSRMKALQRSLLNIERTTPNFFDKGEESENEPPPIPEFSLGPAAMALDNDHELTRNFQDKASTGSSSSTSLTGGNFSLAEREYLQKVIKQNVKQYDVQLNITIVGNSMTGKTSITSAIMGSKFELNTPRSTGLDSKTTYREYKGKKVKLKIIDTDPDKSKEFIKKVYYDMSHAIIVLYDITNQESLIDAEFWVNSIRKQTTNKPFIILVGNKADLKQKRAVSRKISKKRALRYKVPHLEVSAVDQTSVESLISYVIQEVLDNKKEFNSAETKKSAPMTPDTFRMS